MSFPLYDALIKNCRDIDLSLDEKKSFLSMVSKLDEEGATRMFILIRQHQLKDTSDEIFELPYNGKKSENQNIHFDLEEFPFALKQMLYKFLALHTKYMEQKAVAETLS